MMTWSRFAVMTAVLLALTWPSDAQSYRQKDKATLRALDKITGRSTDIQINVNDPIVYGSLKVELQVCFQTPPEEPPESAAFLKINSTQPIEVPSMDEAIEASAVETVNEENPLLFSGWMFASSPGLSALQHPVYDIWVIRCTAPDPVKPYVEEIPAPAGNPELVEDVFPDDAEGEPASVDVVPAEDAMVEDNAIEAVEDDVVPDWLRSAE